MKRFSALAFFALLLVGCGKPQSTQNLPALAAEPPEHVRFEIGPAQACLNVLPHESLGDGRRTFDQVIGKTFRTAKPINTPAEYQALLKAVPWTYLRFGDVFEFDGWFFASLDSPATKEPTWIHGALLKRGTHEISFYSHW